MTGLGTSGDLRFDFKFGKVILEEGRRLLSLKYRVDTKILYFDLET